ncbi:MAG TPA: ABC transporter permease [Vicinamibacterales bacterium]|nr:ABC transporter permease [Vicinamibacterales bacterium]
MRLGERLKRWWRNLTASSQIDAEMDEEMRFHVEMQAERLMRERGLDAAEARRQAHVAFGGVEKWKVEGRQSRGGRWLDHLSLDTRLGLRMLIKHRSLTLIGAFAMTVAVAIGATLFEVISEALTPALPFPQGERIVSIEFATERVSVPEQPRIHDFLDWRNELKSFDLLGAFRTAQRNLATAPRGPHDADFASWGGAMYPEPARVAEISAAAFTIAHTPPHLGRYLVADDERDDASRVLLLGYQEWQRRFAGDAAIVGTIVTVNGVPHTVIGVMPPGFAFPFRHQYWTALREQPAAMRRQGDALIVFGRLAPGATRSSAEAELLSMHAYMQKQFPDQYARLRPVVLPYTLERMDIDRPVFIWALRIMQLLISGLLIVVAINLAVLSYARTLARLPEIAVRSALGASRKRILLQLFMEAFVLSTMSAAAGLYAANLALEWLRAFVPTVEQVPFWLAFDLSAPTVLYALVLAALAATIVGVLPGLKVTGVRLDANLRALGGGSRLRLGPLWTGLIVTQVASASAILPTAVYVIAEVVRMELSEPAFAATEFVIAEVDRRTPEIIRRIEAEPGVRAVTFSSGIPGYEGSRVIEFQDPRAQRLDTDKEVNLMDVDLAMFEVYDATILAGRAFTRADLGTTAVVVNRSFARELLEGLPPLGQRFSYARQSPSPSTVRESFEIVGVVNDFPGFPNSPGSDGVPAMYRPATAESIGDVVLSVRFRGNAPADFAGRLRQIGVDVDPTVPLTDVDTLVGFYSRNRAPWRVIGWALGSIALAVLLLSAAGIYALMSFTVAQRTREIGIRTALGGNPRRILAGVFGRVMMQLGIGLGIGSLLSALVFTVTNLTSQGALALFAVVAGIIAIVGAVAAIGPARHSLSIQTTEALRIDT